MSDAPETASRRTIMAAAAAGLVGMASPAIAAPRELKLADLKKEADVACVYHCDFGDPPRFVQMLTNIANHYSAYGADPFALQLAIVAHGQGVKFFLDSLEETSWRDEVMVPKIFERVEDVAKNGLKVHLCEITFSRLKLDKAKARSAAFISFVPSGVATVAALQSKGFAYMKIG
ncbi:MULTISPECIES: DsrE family protein [Hyphomicrobiales]|jgi:intracellular sulfur oxidation DsrE/DsrF family protein|uniref:DsrE family protein n=1 Tax=Methylobacterium sp. CCH7-A2 TaxID=1768789 RepID=UPI0008332D5F|nr:MULTISPECIES: DsrE family protein [Hyphomicrobiales]